MRNRRIGPGMIASVAGALLLGVSLVMVGGCTPVSPQPATADDWVVIHANRVGTSSTAGEPWDGYTVPPGGEIAWLPTCLTIKAGKRIGFANYYRDDEGGQPVTVELEPAYFGTDKIELAYGESKVVEVVETPAKTFAINIVLKNTPHGGPQMIPKEP